MVCAAAVSAQDDPYAIETWGCTPGFPTCQDNVGPTSQPIGAVTIWATCYNGVEPYQKMVLGTKKPCANEVIAELDGSLSSFPAYEEVVYEVDEVVVTGKVTMVPFPFTEWYDASGDYDCQGGYMDPPPWESGC
jgi:hypothetical protein